MDANFIIIQFMIIGSRLTRRLFNVHQIAKFCTSSDALETPPVRGTAIYFYKRSIQRLTNVNGTFTQHHLIRLTKLSKTLEDIDLLFEGFYNYLGRNAMISSKTMDWMFLKIIQILKAHPDVLKDSYFKKMCYVLSMHECFCYFPNYEVTNQLIELFIDHQDFTKLINIYRTKPLIKMNQKSFEFLSSKLAVLPIDVAYPAFKLIGYRLSYMSEKDISLEKHQKILIASTKQLMKRKEPRQMNFCQDLKKWLYRLYPELKRNPSQEFGYSLGVACALNQQVGGLYRALCKVPEISKNGLHFFKFLANLKKNDDGFRIGGYGPLIEKVIDAKKVDSQVKAIALKLIKKEASKKV